MWLLSVDPGVHAAGAALWFRSELVEAAFVESAEERAITGVADAVAKWVLSHTLDRIGLAVIEKPQVYTTLKLKGDPGDLIDVALAAGCLAGAVNAMETKFVKPMEWKGQIKKPKKGETYIVELRARKRLSEEELSRVVIPKAKSLAHNLWDGVGIGFWQTGR